MFKHILGAAAVAALLSVGCSSSSESTTTTTTDAGRDSGAVRPDSGTVPSADAGAPAAVCEPPASTPTFDTPAALPATAAWGTGVCTDATVQGMLDACLGTNSTKATCDSWKAANAACGACLLTPKNGAAIGPFVTDPATTADDSNPPGLDQDWVQGLLMGCMNHFRAGCGESYFGFANCLDAACNDQGNCKNASDAEVDTCQEDAIGGGQGVCGQVAIAALGQNGKCRGVFPQDAGTAVTGEKCFAQGAAGGEDTTQQAGIDAFLKRVALYYCGPAL
jgi:hypothetical protein